MITAKMKTDLSTIVEKLPEEKAAELYDFARFLDEHYSKNIPSSADENALLMQQESLAKIWDSPQEDIYELKTGRHCYSAVSLCCPQGYPPESPSGADSFRSFYRSTVR
ncbi:MAG: DUF2281 domain-containing protein [Chitinivibrionales bacterium]|nr:DUF2281 domain-containing protein [Chitinivibrionales bacterium]